ncbi:MAG: hypothetical protein WKG00_33405 [Polyangiaceae bacterium]
MRAHRYAPPVALRTLALLAAVTGAALVAGDAVAGEPAPPSHASSADARALPLRARPTWASIPRASIPAPPSHDGAPSALASTEQVSGFSVENNGTAGSPRVRAFVETTPARRSCLANDVDYATSADPTLRDRTTVAHMRLGVVTALRAERLVVEGKSASLEITDLWIDPRSRGLRIIQSERLPLAVLARGPGGADVYGYRDASDQLWAVVPMSTRATAVDSDGEQSLGDCGHARLSAGQSGAQVALGWNEPPPKADTPPEARFPRQLLVTVTASRSSRDRQPVVSVVMALTPERTALEVLAPSR